MSRSEERPSPGIPRGHIAIVLRPFGSPGDELRALLRPPWPDWVTRLYALEEAGDRDIDADQGQTSAGAAVGALAARLGHRLDTLGWVLSSMAELGWRIQLRGDELVASRLAARDGALDELDRAGVLGALISVANLDEEGMPVIVPARRL